MLVLGVDIGGSTRNAMTLMDSDSEKILKYSYVPFDSRTKYDHRNKVLAEVLRYTSEYHIDKMIFEAIRLYRGGRVSPLANIISLSKIQTKFIDNLSDIVDMYDVQVQEWKANILSNRNADKYESIRYVEGFYPEVDLKIIEHHKRKGDVEVINHDLADSVCIALYGCRHLDKFNDNNKLNYT